MGGRWKALEPAVQGRGLRVGGGGPKVMPAFPGKPEALHASCSPTGHPSLKTFGTPTAGEGMPLASPRSSLCSGPKGL